jgi:hypothetical protein
MSKQSAREVLARPDLFPEEFISWLARLMRYGPGQIEEKTVAGGGIKEITSTGGTVDITAPTGPTTNLEVSGGVTRLQGYRWGLAQADVGTPTSNLVLSGAVIGQYYDGASDDSTGSAWIQKGFDSAGSSDRPTTCVGNLFAAIVDPALIAGTALQVYPSWQNDAQGVGPYFIVGQLIGRACIQQLSDTGARYWCDLVMTDHAFATLIYDGDGSTVTKTNPITLAATDIITGYWAAIVQGWE